MFKHNFQWFFTVSSFQKSLFRFNELSTKSMQLAFIAYFIHSDFEYLITSRKQSILLHKFILYIGFNFICLTLVFKIFLSPSYIFSYPTWYEINYSCTCQYISSIGDISHQTPAKPENFTISQWCNLLRVTLRWFRVFSAIATLIMLYLVYYRFVWYAFSEGSYLKRVNSFPIILLLSYY